MIFCHSLVSDWNHGNAHFLRGIVSELTARGHHVRVLEPEEGWSRQNLLRDQGNRALEEFHTAFPKLKSETYRADHLCLTDCLDAADLVLVHEWNDPELIAALGEHRRRNSSVRTLFHDTHHRAVTAPEEMARFDRSDFDGVLAYGNSLRQAYQKIGWGKQVHTWHEAADTRIFHPFPEIRRARDLVWIGNWGDEERTEELREFFIEPCAALSIKAQAYGVRYPSEALEKLATAGIDYGGWLPNHRVPKVFAQFHATVHIPRRPYTRQLPGIPTIRPFEALACGIPLVSAPWQDVEGLFRVGVDFLMARDGNEMKKHLNSVLGDRDLAQSLAQHGLETIRSRHTCAHRVDELLDIYNEMKPVLATTAQLPLAETCL